VSAAASTTSIEYNRVVGRAKHLEVVLLNKPLLRTGL
jgi:hypothetical protein